MLRSALKQVIVALAMRRLLPAQFATWLIQVIGARHA